MKRIVTTIIILFFSQNLIAQDNEEFRATWVITWHLINSSASVESNQARARNILDNHKDANMNAVLWQCRQSGTAYYNSSYEPWGYYAGSSDPGYDPLAYAVEEAHKRGLELHAWFNVFQTSSTATGSPAAEHPEWVCRDQSGIPMTSSQALSPGIAAVREYTINVAMEIVNNYDIDGLHLDYVRWNEHTGTAQGQNFAKALAEYRMVDGNITEEQIQHLNANQAGRYLYDSEHPYSAGIPDSTDGGQFPSWEEWWRWSVTEFVSGLHDSIQAVKPWVRLSAAALGKYNWSGWQGYGTVYQDAALWFNEGYVDQLTPMHYHWLSASAFYGVLAGGTNQSWEPWIQKGIADGRLFSAGPGSYRFAENNVWGRHPGVVEISRTIPWVDGFQFFSYGSWEDYDYWTEAGNTFFGNKTKIRDSGLIVSAAPDAPSGEVTKIDSLNYTITVTPPVSVVNDVWYAIYRSPDNVIDRETDRIVDIHFGTSSYLFTDNFTGLQDFNQPYFYAATVLDRYWNESDVSNVLTTDPIPSFPPTLISTDPLEGDSIAVNSSILIKFSKSVDTTSVENSISFIPSINISSFSWSEGNSSLEIKTDGNFDYATGYTMTIDSSAADVNGKPIDGNSDGIGGDPFYLNFKTLSLDDVSPVLLFSYPDQNGGTDSFDVEEAVTVVFDELIDPQTVYRDSTLVLMLNNEEVKTDFLYSEVGDKSLIDLKSFQSLIPDTEYSLLLRNTVTDTTGNVLNSDISFNFITANLYYIEEILIDNFYNTTYWQQPGYSGSTKGIVKPATTMEFPKNFYLPASEIYPLLKRSACLKYQWEDPAPPEGYLIREYLSGGPPRSVTFDTTYTLQCYVYGDGSKNKFRFCIDEAHGSSWPDHEVSNWLTIDWYGWKLIEWDLSDPTSVGSWLSTANEILDGSNYRIDSFQLTHDNTGAVSGQIYFDDLRLVKKSTSPVAVDDYPEKIPGKFFLYQNYPNPFNPTTTIPFSLKKKGVVQLKVYDLNGREVATIVNRTLEAGSHQVHFDATGLSSGLYFYRLIGNGQVLTKSMMFVK